MAESLFNSEELLKQTIRKHNAFLNNMERDRVNKNLQRRDITQLPPTYKIVDFSFDQNTRKATISFEEFQIYKTIDRYVQRNYVRTPIYSDWKRRSKIIKKSIKLTNEVLESLYENEDRLIADYATEIIEKLDDVKLVPSWFFELLLRGEKLAILREEKKSADDAINAQQNIKKETDSKLFQTLKKKRKETRVKDRLEKSISKIDSKEKKIDAQKKNICLAVMTLGMYYSSFRKKHINMLKAKKVHKRKVAVEQLEKTLLEEDKLSKKLKECDLTIETIRFKLNEKEKEIEATYNGYLANIKPLSTEIKCNDTSFISLKELIGLKYEKIIGCYVIHNKEFDKYYVGQSKDVIKRITRDHFNGTVVKNIIFAKDYYKSSWEDKSELFEVKIIQLNTKDELDSTEKQLIEEYDSFTNGYNGTSGNN